MKNLFLIVCFSFITYFAFPQSTFDKALDEVSADIAGKLSLKSKKKIVVLYVTDINKAQTVAGKYIADVISVNIVNNQGNFEVFDRENLSSITEANKLIEEGYINTENAKELGKILAVEAIVIGNYTVLTTTLKLTLKALDVNSGFVIAATMKDLPITADAGALLGINVGSGDNGANRGFNNQPLNSNESYNNPETVNSKCSTKNTGDYCFQNNTKYNLSIGLITTPGPTPDFTCTLQPGQMQCFYDLPVGSAKYMISSANYNGAVSTDPIYYPYQRSSQQKDYKSNGQIYVEQCKSKTFVIK
jgi:hypothetical protein